MQCKLQRETKMSSRRTDNIKALSEWLGFLQIMNEASEEYKQIDTEMSRVPAPVIVNNNIQVTIPKNIVLDPGQFDRDQTKFEDWQKEI